MTKRQRQDVSIIGLVTSRHTASVHSRVDRTGDCRIDHVCAWHVQAPTIQAGKYLDTRNRLTVTSAR